jgi:internalin A
LAKRSRSKADFPAILELPADIARQIRVRSSPAAKVLAGTNRTLRLKCGRPSVISTMTAGLVAALLANQIETSRPVVGPLEPRFRGGIDVRADGTNKTGYSTSEPLRGGHWVVLRLAKTRGSLGSGNCFGTEKQEPKRTPPQSARRAEIGSANAGGCIACDLETGRALELIAPPPQRQPDRVNSVAAYYRTGSERCAVVIEQFQKNGPDTGKSLGSYLWEWSLADNSIRPIGKCDAAALLRLNLDPQFVEVSLVETDENRDVTLDLRDRETGRKTQVLLENPRPFEPFGPGESAAFGGQDMVIPQPDCRSFVVYRPALDGGGEPFFRVDPRRPNGRAWSLSQADFERRTGRKASLIFPIGGLSCERGLIAVALTHNDSGIDHVVTVDAATGRIEHVAPLPESDADEDRRDWIISPDGSTVAYISDLRSDSRNATSLVQVDVRTGRATRFVQPAQPFHWISGVFALDQRGRLLTADDDQIERVTIGNPPSFETLFALNPRIAPQDRVLTATGLRQLANLQSLTSLELSRTAITAGMFGELSRLHGLTDLRINNEFEPVGDLKGLGQCANLRSLTLSGTLADQNAYREISGLCNLQKLDLQTGGWMLEGALDELGKLTNLVSLRMDGSFQGKFKLTAFEALKNLRSLEFGPALDDASFASISKLSQLEELNLQLAKGTEIKQLTALPKLADLSLGLNGDSQFDLIIGEVAKCRRLRRLRLFELRKVSAVALQQLAQLPELAELDLEGGGIDLGERPLDDFADFKSLTRLRLGNYSLGPEDVDEIRKFRHLKVLSHTETRNQASGWRNLHWLQGLEELDEYRPVSREPGLTDEDMPILAKLPSLRALQLAGNAITDNGLGPIAKLPLLSRLKLAHTYITDRGLATFKPLSRLAELDLFDTEISDDGLKELATLRSLTNLDLGMTEITDAGLAHLRRLPALKRLNLESTAISDAGLCHLAGLESLEELDLSGTAITDAGLRQLWPLKNLRSLSLKRTAVTDAGLGKLEAFPRLASLAIGR